ncbi:MAG: aromatic amino acid transport family protein [Candidatus Nanoarchaeia archaeon]
MEKRSKEKSKGGLLFAAIATLTGTAIGAGFLGIPHVVAKSGFLIGLIQMIILALIIMLVNLYIGEVILRTKETHQLPGYASKYLGKWARALMVCTMVFGIYAAMTAYFIGEGQVLSFIFTGNLSYSLWFSLAFFVIIALLVYRGIEALKEGETFGLIAVLSIVTILAIVFSPKINLNNLTYSSDNIVEWFLPYGVILFSFLSFSALPEVKQEIKNNEKIFKKAIIIGALIPLIAYTIFTMAVVGFAGKATPEIATIALGKIPSLLAVFTMFTACFALSNAIRDMYKWDLKIKQFWAWLLTIIIPLIVFLVVTKLQLATFTMLLEFGGAIVGGLTGILAVLMLLKAKKLGDRKPEYTIYIDWIIATILILIFAAGIIYQFVF